MTEEITDVTPKMDNNMEEDSSYEELDINDVMNFTDSTEFKGTKPTFEVNTLATITEVKVKRSKRSMTTKNGDSVYYPLIVTICATTDDGQTTYDNYGGLRETAEGILWCGDGSALGKLLKLCKNEKEGLDNFGEFFKYLQSGLRVKIRTQTTSYQDKEYKKNMITQII